MSAGVSTSCPCDATVADQLGSGYPQMRLAHRGADLSPPHFRATLLCTLRCSTETLTLHQPRPPRGVGLVRWMGLPLQQACLFPREQAHVRSKIR